MKKLLIILAIMALIALPLVMFKNGEFKGTDDNAVVAIESIDQNYQPWFKGIKLFDSPEIVSTFFAIQAAIGAGILGYYVGFTRGRKDVKEK